MSKILTTDAEIRSQTPLGTEPLFILKIEWPSGTKYYSEKTYTFDGNVCETRLLPEDRSVKSQGRIGSISEVSSIDFSLDDTDSDLKDRINTDIIEGVVATAYHHYADLPASDAVIIIKGKIAGPINWSEGERIFTASIESFIGTGEVGFAPIEDSIENLLDSAINIPWPIVFGNPKMVKAIKVQQIEPTEEELIAEPEMTAYDLIYIINLVSSASIQGVFAKRNCYGKPGFFEVPSSYYTINTSYSYGGKTVTAILMDQPLSTQDDSGWENEIYISLTSSLSSNTATQIKWIIDTYATGLTTDAASFSSVASDLANLPSHWVLFSQPDPLQLAEEMAWQCRCALIKRGGVVFMQNLANVPDSVFPLTANEIELKSSNLKFSDTDEIVTKLKATWKTDYSDEAESSKEFIYTNNTDKFGTIDQTQDFYIYTNLECVKVAATFWGYRYSNSWRQLDMITFLPTLPLEPFDWVDLNLLIFSEYSLPALILSVGHNVSDHRIEIECEVASSAGTATGGQPSLDSGYYDAGDEYIPGSSPNPVASVELHTICEPLIDGETINNITTYGDSQCLKCRIVDGSSVGYLCHEIVGLERDGTYKFDQDGNRVETNILLLGSPTKSNQEPDKIVFTNPDSIFGGQVGCCYSASSPQWVDYDLNPGIHPNYSESNQTRVGDTVGTIKGSKELSKKSFGFNVVGVDGGEIAVTNGSLDPKLEKIKADEAIEAYNPAENKGSFNDEHTIVQKPSANSLPPGRIIFPIQNLAAGEEGLGYNAFNAEAFADGAEPSAIGVELGTKAGSDELNEFDDEGNPLEGFVFTGRKGGKNQVRPFRQKRGIIYACLLETNFKQYWNGRVDSNGYAWNTECYLDLNNCLILPGQIYKIFYIEVKNQIPYLRTEEQLFQYSLGTSFNQNLFRHWLQEYSSSQEDYFNEYFNNGCSGNYYIADPFGMASINRYNLNLPDGQKILIEASLHGIVCITGKESNIENFNLSDSWIDIGLYYNDEYQGEKWRVYGINPDPWDAPDHIKNAYGSWPPTTGEGVWSIKQCNHLTANESGEYKDGNNTIGIEDVYRIEKPSEVAAWAVKGAEQGRLYNQLNNNQFVHNIISTQFKKLRIEQPEIGLYRIYIGIGETRIEGYDSNSLIQIADNTNAWESRSWIIKFDLQNHEILNYQSGFEVFFEFFDDETVLYDSDLEIDRIGARLFGTNSLSDELSVSGATTFLTILDQQKLDLENQGFTVSNTLNSPLLKEVGDD